MLDWPAGQWLVALGGIILIGFALWSIKHHVIDQSFTKRLDKGDGTWVARLGQAGYGARALVYIVIGWFFVQAAITYDPNQAKGLSGALAELAGKSWGQLLLWAIALGLFCYGLFCVAEAKYRKAA